MTYTDVKEIKKDSQTIKNSSEKYLVVSHCNDKSTDCWFGKTTRAE